MDRGKMLSLLAIRRGNVSTPQPTPPGTFLLRGAQRGSPFSPVPPSVFSTPPLSSKRGQTEDLEEFVQPGSVGQVCERVHTPRENEWHLQVPRPGVLSLTLPAIPPDPAAREGRGSQDP